MLRNERVVAPERHFDGANRVSRLVLAVLICFAVGPFLNAATTTCTTGQLPPGNGGDLVVNTGICKVVQGTYRYHNVNIYGGGTLQFADAKIDFWAESILVENNGSLIAGTAAGPIGTAGGVLTIHLYGQDQGTNSPGGQGIPCATPTNQVVGPCGVPMPTWTSNTVSVMNPTSCVTRPLPGNVNDCFYQYQPLDYDGGGTPPGYFGYKVLAVSYGGTLQLLGKKGASYSTLRPASSGTSWARLNGPIKPCTDPPCSTLVLDRAVDWQPGDQIVLTTTDYLPGHSEQLTIASVSTEKGVTSVVTSSVPKYGHDAKLYSLSNVPAGIGPDPDPYLPPALARKVETRAAVALLTRSIRLVSEGNNLNDPFPPDTSGYYFGGHTIARQGFQLFQMQGVEFFHMGQGGRIMHYPVHFHMARQAPANTFVSDSSVHDSMTRWYTIHATQNVTLQRNVGYLSIGNGYYLEDGTETGNKLYANIGIFARAAIENAQNPRNVPGILAGTYSQVNTDTPPYQADVDHPSVFWIMNGWNDFEYNVAAGAGSCGMCYWLLPGGNSGASRYEYWTGYPAEQQMTQSSPGVDVYARAGLSPLQKFVGNSCVSAQNSFFTIGPNAPCYGVAPTGNSQDPQVMPVPNPLAPTPPAVNQPLSSAADMYYPKVNPNGGRTPTLCPSGQNCATQVMPCSDGPGQVNCAITAIDHYTTSFNWAQTNFAAMWLRSQWYLVSNGAITDIQNGGLTFVSGGGYAYSDEIPGYWALAHKNVFIGQTQPNNPFALDAGPFNPKSGLKCAPMNNNGGNEAAFCLNVKEGVSLPLLNFAANQRFFNIYDGPSFEDSNAYLDINSRTLSNCTAGQGYNCQSSGWMYGNVTGVPLDPKAASGSQCYLPNAGIGWKQPNAFYYPPAFTSTNLFFNNVDIRHFVIEPLFTPGTYGTDSTLIGQRYCNDAGGVGGPSGMFAGFTDIDRQTELTDEDGSLTGLTNTISVNKDPFFNAPVSTVECASDTLDNMPAPWGSCSLSEPLCGTANTSPYDYVTTVEYPGCGSSCAAGVWDKVCEDPSCYGVPLYRQDLVPSDNGTAPYIRMAGQGTWQRSSLTVNNGVYYVDSAVSQATQQQWGAGNFNVFQAGQTYYTFLLFAKSTTTQTYQMYVGANFNPADASQLWVTRADQGQVPVTFSTDTQDTITECASGKQGSNFPWCYTYANGILSVTMNMNFPEFTTAYQQGEQDSCQPASYCTWNSSNNSCGCALGVKDFGYSECQHACSTWATKAVSCPDGGCFGFGVTLPADFSTTDQAPPSGQCFPDNSTWGMPFVAASSGTAGSCFYNTVPTGSFCTNGRKRR